MNKTIIFSHTPKHIKDFFDDIAKIDRAIETGGDYEREIKRVTKKYNRIAKKRPKNKMA